MKYVLSTLMVLLFANFSSAQTHNFSSDWEKVEQFEKEGLPKSALKIVEEIEQKAKKYDVPAQHIKVLLFKSKYALQLEEDAQLNIIKDFKSEINQNEFPTKHLLENVLANLYWQYFNQNRWKFYNRTKTETKVDVDPSTGSGESDFRTWDLQTLFDEIHIHFQNSLQNGLLAQRTELSKFDAILHTQKGSKKIRPTLFDFLSHNALQFYKTSENQITKPAYKFEISDTSYLSDALTFSELNITSKDSASLQLNALKIYQDLIRFHLLDGSPKALANVNIERLLYVKQNATFNDKDVHLLKALKTESELHNNDISGLYDYEIAVIYLQQGSTYNYKTNSEPRWKIKEALEICNSVIKTYPESIGAQKCKDLKNAIFIKQLNITAENFIPVNQNSKILVSFKNINQLSFKVIPVSKNQLEKFQKTYRKEEQLKFINKLEAAHSWSSVLKDEKDYQTHSTEIVIPKLNNGHYILFAAPNENDATNYAFSTIQVTDFALVERRENDKNTYQVIDRTNGKPIANASVKATFVKNYKRSTTSQSFTTNGEGEFYIEKTSNNLSNLIIEVTKDSQKAVFGSYYVNNKYKPQKEKDTYKGFLFTDRSIYRPGQTVYFKGIAIQNKEGKSSVLPNMKLNVMLRDVNRQEIKTIDFVTNEFGSFHGHFVLPENGLTGSYNLNISCEKVWLDGNANISVEEYKRPKFETKFNPVTETFKINDLIIVKGNATAYAGSNITDAKVIFRVHRKVQYPRWYSWYRPWFNSEPQEIEHGEVTTNDKGVYEIMFKAIPDKSVSKEGNPVFQYEVTADVTDINGETRSATTIVNVGYHAMTANISVDNRLDKTDKNHKISIDTKNLNGEFVPAEGTIKIYKLKAPESVLRRRPWIAPDYPSLNKEAFKKLFPYEAYQDEHNSSTWQKGEEVFSKSFDTEKNKELELGNMKRWTSGQYVIELKSQDKFGQEVKDEARFMAYSNKDQTLADNELFSATHTKDIYKAGDQVILTLGSSISNVFVTVDVEKDKKVVNTYVLQLNNNKKTISIPVTKEDIGGFAIHTSFSAFNSYQSSMIPIAVPYPKSDLEIETMTFRDKLQPGTEETWSFKIKGPKGDKVAAELLASMYDTSLDQFKPHNWNFSPLYRPTYYPNSNRNANRTYGIKGFRSYLDNNFTTNYRPQPYDQLNWFGLYFGNNYYARQLRGQAAGVMITEDSSVDEVKIRGYSNVSKKEEILAAPAMEEAEMDASGALGLVGGAPSNDESNSEESSINQQKETDFSGVTIRKNLQETAFFYPNLQTDNEGNVSFSFTTPEALTKWNLQLLAHTKSLESATRSLSTVTQKELMVIPNAPRFLRQGDQISISTKIANLSDKDLSGVAVLQLFDAVSGKSIDQELSNAYNELGFDVTSKGNTQVTWNLNIPDNIQAMQYKVIAKAGEFSDGEQNALPVLTNRMLVTETLPMWIRSNQTKTFTLDKLKVTNSSTLKHHKLTLEMTSNPAWYAVQALPYLMEYPYECNEQTFSRYYANALASHIANSNPRIQEVFNQWRNTDALLSNLEKNQELKSLLIQETPWLRDAQSETEQKKRIALLFDLNKMNNELESAIRKLKNNQMGSGAWPWFKGGRENRYITQHIITGFGHLNKLGVIQNDSEKPMIEKAIRYLDTEFIQEFKDITKYDKDVDLNKDHLSYTQLHYLYMRSFYPEIKKSKQVEEVMTYYQTQIQKYWLKRSLYAKGLMALVVHRMDDSNTANKIIRSLKETSITSEELGMYWKANTNSWYWYQAPIETQALLIETFSEIENDTETIDNLKIWLLKNKQTNRWKTTKATTEAVYALLLQGSDWLSVTDMVDIVLGNEPIEPSKLEDVKVEAGTGYFKTSWSSSEIKPDMADVKISKKGKGIAWGAIYWQYFEDLDKITSAKTPLKLKKKLFKKINTDTGEEISEITSETKLEVGDLVRVRIELRVDRAMEFIHMKDMRAAGFEPVNVLSQYKWQDGLGYYESTKDAATNFFFDYLPKGVYVFEYDLRINNAGDMSNGITTIQSMYAPEFSSHSEGVRVTVN